METTQISLQFSTDVLNKAKEIAQENGFLNIQEFIRDLVREKINENELKESYVQRLLSKDAQTFVCDEEADIFDKNLEKRAKLE